jgi:hypothetical protein
LYNKELEGFLHGTRDKFIIKLNDIEFIQINEFYTNFEQIKDQLTDIDGYFPSGIYPFAYDNGGNLICFSDGEVLKGGIYFWDHEKYDEADNAYELIANDLAEFEEMLA